MAADYTETPDLLGAGVPQDPATSPSMLDALGTAGNGPAMPPGALAGASPATAAMGPLLMSLLSGPTPMQQIAQGLAGGVAAVQGTANPVTAMLDQQAKQRLGIGAMLERMAAQQDLNAYRKSELDLGNARLEESRRQHQSQELKAQLGVMKDFMMAPNASPESIAWATREMGKITQKLGWGDLPPTMVSRVLTEAQKQDFVKDLWRVAERGPDGALVKDANGSLVVSPDSVASLQQGHPYVPAGDIPLWAAKVANPEVAKSFGLRTETDAEKEFLEIQGKKVELWAKQNPQFSGPMAGWGNEFVQRMLPGKSITDLTYTNASDASVLEKALAYANQRKLQEQALADSRALIQKQAESNIIQGREIAVAGAKQAMQPPKFNDQQVARLTKPLDVGQDMATFGVMEQAAKGMANKGLLAANTSVLAQKQAQFQQWWNSGDVDALMVKQLIGPQFLGRVDRYLYDEKNVRLAAAFREQVNLVNNAPTLEGIQKLIGFYRYMFGAQAAKQMRMLESSAGKIDPDVMGYARELYKDNFPNGVPADPTLPAVGTPLNPAPVGRYNPLTGQVEPIR